MSVDVCNDGSARSEEYSKRMKKEMGSSLTYCHEDGMNYSKPFPRLLVGSCPQTPADVDLLRSEGVDVVFCLQEDADMAHFSLDLAPIKSRASEIGIEHVRIIMRDFDPISLRRSLPEAVKRVVEAMAVKPNSQAYIHCTAGLGRAPGLALAYMFWVNGVCLDEAYKELYAVRRCHPQIGMIRAATCDILAGEEGDRQTVKLAYSGKGAAEVDIAGLDIGWKNRLRLEANSSGEFSIVREIPPGRYQYKFIVDGEWMPDPTLPTVNDNGNINNVLEVAAVGGSDSADAVRRTRLMADGGRPTDEELTEIRSYLGVGGRT